MKTSVKGCCDSVHQQPMTGPPENGRSSLKTIETMTYNCTKDLLVFSEKGKFGPGSLVAPPTRTTGRSLRM